MGRRTTKPPPSRYFLAWKLLSTRLSGIVAAVVAKEERARGSRRHAGAAAARAARSARAAVAGAARVA